MKYGQLVLLAILAAILLLTPKPSLVAQAESGAKLLRMGEPRRSYTENIPISAADRRRLRPAKTMYDSASAAYQRAWRFYAATENSILADHGIKVGIGTCAMAARVAPEGIEVMWRREECRGRVYGPLPERVDTPSGVFEIERVSKMGEHVNGETFCEDRKIFVLRLPPEKEREVVTHEVMHAAITCSEEDFREAVNWPAIMFDPRPAEHAAIYGAAPAFMKVVTENPELRDYLFGKERQKR